MAEQLAQARALSVEPFDLDAVRGHLAGQVDRFQIRLDARRRVPRAVDPTLNALAGLAGDSLQQRWASFETTVWPRWRAGQGRPAVGEYWAWGARALVVSRLVTPSWTFLAGVPIPKWVNGAVAGDPLLDARQQLSLASSQITFGGNVRRAAAVNSILRVMLTNRLDHIDEITEEMVAEGAVFGGDCRDAILCQAGVFDRSPRSGARRLLSTARHAPADMPAVYGVPEPFTAVCATYLQTYALRMSDVYPTLQHKAKALAHFFGYLAAEHPQITRCADVTPAHGRGFVDHQLKESGILRRGRFKDTGAPSGTAFQYIITVRVFFDDLCTWASEPGSPFAEHAPRITPISRQQTRALGAGKARKRAEARLTSQVLDLQREIPNIRALALRRWNDAKTAALSAPGHWEAADAERCAFWHWAFLELLLTSGLRVEEACELTTLDILKRALPDGRLYYLLHVKPSKYGRARVIPIGDQLGRVLAEIITHVRDFYGTPAVPPCDRRDEHEKRPLPAAPYLLQGVRRPTAVPTNTIRAYLRRLSSDAGARRADGSPLQLAPHDCRRVFASEHLNGNTPIHVIQALLGHATANTVMIYAKLYPTQLVEDYRRAMRGTYGDLYGPGAHRTPSPQEWSAFAQSCDLRDMGTHLCALPTGEHCPKGALRL